MNFPGETLKKISHRLYIRSPHIGGKISHRSTVIGWTEILINDNLFWSHPFYAKKDSWHDCVYFRWHGIEKAIATRTIMIIYLWEYEILHHIDQYPDTLPDDTHQRIIPHLNQDKWVVLLVSESSKFNTTELTAAHFDSKILKHVKLYDDKVIWIIQLSTLVGPYVVVYKKDCVIIIMKTNHKMTELYILWIQWENWGDAFITLKYKNQTRDRFQNSVSN